VTAETYSWWNKQVESSGEEIVVTCHQHMLRETTVRSSDYEGVPKNPDGSYRSENTTTRMVRPRGRHTFTSSLALRLSADTGREQPQQALTNGSLIATIVALGELS
jgi:hypothetical protein